MSSVSAQAAIKWHPGHYVMLNGGDSPSTHLKHIDEIGGVAAIKGVEIKIWWHDLEPSKGVYDFSLIDMYLSRLKAQPTPKRLVVRVMDRQFNTTSKSNIVPDYLRTSYYDWGLVQTHTGFAAKIWEKPVMDRLISLYKAIGWHYDWNPYFEGVATEETTLSLPTPYPSGYSDWALEAQYKRMVTGIRSAMPRSNLFLVTNWLGGSASILEDLVQALIPPPSGAGSSNIDVGKLTTGQKVLTGYYGSDYRGILAMMNRVEGRELGVSTPQQINDYAYNTLKLNYIFWARNTWSGTSASLWYTGLLPYLKSNPRYHSACPSSYGTCAW